MQYSNFSSYDKKPKPKFHIGILILVIIFVFIICFLIYMYSATKVDIIGGQVTETSPSVNIPDKVTETTPIVTTAVTTILPPMVNPVPEHSRLDNTYLDDCVFIGDSLTVGLSGYGFIPEERVLASVGMNIDKIDTANITTASGDITIIEALKAVTVSNIYIMLGSNGIAWISNEQMIKKYSDFINEVKTIKPDATIYILSIPPVAPNRETASSGPILNTSIDSYNSELLKLANEKEIFFVDINTALKGNDGKLPADMSGKDGMHFKKETYEIMVEYILSHVNKSSE